MPDYNNKKILILFAHPAMQKSRVNKRLIEPLSNVEGVTFHDLYDSYPDLYIDVEREKSLLLENDIIIFHHPFYWYSSPAIIKEWQDLVLEFGFAYGPGGCLRPGWYSPEGQNNDECYICRGKQACLHKGRPQ